MWKWSIWSQGELEVMRKKGMSMRQENWNMWGISNSWSERFFVQQMLWPWWETHSGFSHAAKTNCLLFRNSNVPINSSNYCTSHVSDPGPVEKEEGIWCLSGSSASWLYQYFWFLHLKPTAMECAENIFKFPSTAEGRDDSFDNSIKKSATANR